MEEGGKGGRNLHSSTFRLNVTLCLWDTLDGVSMSMPKVAQAELKHDEREPLEVGKKRMEG